MPRNIISRTLGALWVCIFISAHPNQNIRVLQNTVREYLSSTTSVSTLQLALTVTAVVREPSRQQRLHADLFRMCTSGFSCRIKFSEIGRKQTKKNPHTKELNQLIISLSKAISQPIPRWKRLHFHWEYRLIVELCISFCWPGDNRWRIATIELLSTWKAKTGSALEHACKHFYERVKPVGKALF